MKPTDLFQSILNRYLKIEQVNLVVEYLTNHDNSRRNETKKTLRQLVPQDILESLSPQIAELKSYSDKKLAFFTLGGRLFLSDKNKKQIVTFLKDEISRKIRNDIMYFACFSNLLTSYSLFFMDRHDRVWSTGITIAKLVVLYFVILPFLLDKLINNDIVTDYIEHTISLYIKSLSRVPERQLLWRFDDLLRDDYKELFVKLNKSRTPNHNPPIPSLKSLSAFYVKHNTDTDINRAPIPDDLKDFVKSDGRSSLFTSLTTSACNYTYTRT